MADVVENTDNKETPEERFKRLAEGRVNTIIEWTEKLGRLANPSLYSYTNDQIDKIEAALTKSLDDALKALKGRKESAKGAFTL